MFVEGKSRTVFFPSDTLIYGISRDGSKNYNIRTCEHMILGQLRMGARQTSYAPLIADIFSWTINIYGFFFSAVVSFPCWVFVNRPCYCCRFCINSNLDNPSAFPLLCQFLETTFSFWNIQRNMILICKVILWYFHQ